MINYYYRGVNADGQEVTGEREAEDRFSLARTLRAEGLTVLIVESAGDRRKKNSFWKFQLTGGRIKLKDKIVFANNLSAMLGAGLSLSRALSVLSRQTSNHRFSRVLSEVEKKVNAGESFSRALASYPKVFSEVFIAMVETAEESGKLPETLKLVSGQLEKSYDLRRKISGALVYPSIIVAVIVIIGVLMMIFLVPTLSATFRDLGVPLPLSTKVVIGLSDFLVNNIVIVVVTFLLAIAMLISFLRTRLGKIFLSRLFLLLPVFGPLTWSSNSATILRTVSSLVSAGVSLTRALEISARVVSNVYYQRVLVEAQAKIQKGTLFSAILAENNKLFPVFAGEMAAVGEETGRLSDLLLKGAEFFEDDVDQVTKNLTTIVEPILMVIVGLAVGLFAISMIGPMYSLSNAIK